MEKVESFLTTNRTNIFIGIIAFFLILIFVGGIIIGNQMKSNQNLNDTLKQNQKELKSLSKEVKLSKKQSELYRDSAIYYKKLADESGLQAEEIGKQGIKIIYETKKQVDAVSKFTNSEHVKFFSTTEEEYRDSTNR